MKARYAVDIIESEAGWGQSLDERKHFTSKVKADAFVKEYNSHNNKKTVPDYYMRASEPYLVDLDEYPVKKKQKAK